MTREQAVLSKRGFGVRAGAKRSQGGRRLWQVTILGAACVSLVLAGGAGAQVSVDCDATTDFCTGNPCTVSEEIIITVPVCNLDFGSDDLIINEKINVPNNGALILKAASITVNEQIRGRHSRSSEPDGADITLMATNDIEINKRVDSSGRNSVGTISLEADGNIAVNRQLRARTFGPNAPSPGGTVNVSAGGVLSTIKRGKIDVRGKTKGTPAGTVNLSGNAGANLKGRVEARGSAGGTVVIVSTNGDVTLEEELRTQGDPGDGGSISISGVGVALKAKKGRALATGDSGGSISISGTVNVTVDTVLRAPGLGANGGTITVTSLADLTLKKADARGKTVGGTIVVAATAGDVVVESDLLAQSDGTGGSISLIGANVGLDKLNVNGTAAGGTITVNGMNVHSNKSVSAESKQGTGGSISFTGDNLTLNGANAKGKKNGGAGGTIVAAATNDLTAKNKFLATPSPPGCIALSAGGTLTTTGATFDPPFQSSCP